jgi:hypothetical protein
MKVRTVQLLLLAMLAPGLRAARAEGEAKAPAPAPTPAAECRHANLQDPAIHIERHFYDEEQTSIRAEIPLKGKVIHGTARFYHPNGAVEHEVQMQEGQHEGDAKKFSDKKVLLWQATYRNDIKDGLEHIYFDSGELHKIIPWKDGKIDGVMKVYTRTGQLVWEKPYVADQLQGIVKAYDENGTPISEEEYRDGEKVAAETPAPADAPSL